MFLLLLCAASAPEYMDRPDVLFGGIFFLLMLVMLSIAYVIRKVPQIVMIVPLLIVVLAFESDTLVKTYRESNLDNLPPDVCVSINEAIMGQIMDVAERGENTMNVEIPKEGPYWYIGHAVAEAMLNCGLIDHEMFTTDIPCDDFFERYGIVQ